MPWSEYIPQNFRGEFFRLNLEFVPGTPCNQVICLSLQWFTHQTFLNFHFDSTFFYSNFFTLNGFQNVSLHQILNVTLAIKVMKWYWTLKLIGVRLSNVEHIGKVEQPVFSTSISLTYIVHITKIPNTQLNNMLSVVNAFQTALKIRQSSFLHTSTRNPCLQTVRSKRVTFPHSA